MFGGDAGTDVKLPVLNHKLEIEARNKNSYCEH